MADGRVAKLTISPGIGCTVYHNDSGKALSATFFSNVISTDANSKMTVVVASAQTTITKQEVLWQPSYCLRCYLIHRHFFYKSQKNMKSVYSSMILQDFF